MRYNRGAGRGNQSRRGSQTSKPTNSQPGESNRGGFQSYVRRRNPHDADGNYMKCHTCESIMHFKRDCPHAQSRKEQVMEASSNEEVYKVHDYSSDDKQVLMVEATNSAVLDSPVPKL